VVSVVKKSTEACRKWYNTNKDIYNKKRRLKYHSDSVYRAKIIAKRMERVVSTKNSNPQKVYRQVQGQVVRVYRITEAAKLVGVMDHTLRGWEKRGFIPKPTIKARQRMYTLSQVSLIKKVAFWINKHSIRKDYLHRIKVISIAIAVQWPHNKEIR